MSGVDAYKKTVLFRRISDSAWAVIRQHLTLERLSTNAVVTSAGSPGNVLYYIAEGSILLQSAVHEVDRPLLILQKGEYFGEFSVLVPGTRVFSAKTADNTVLVKLSNDGLEQIRAQDPQAHWELVQTLLKLYATKAKIVNADLEQIINAQLAAGQIGPSK